MVCGSVFDIISLGLTVSSILIGAATFLLGFYLTERNRGVPSARLRVFKYLIFSVIVPSFLIIVGAMCFILAESTDSINIFVVFCALVSLIPAFAITIALITAWE